MAKTRNSQTIPIQLAVAEQDLKLAMAARAKAAYEAAIDTPGAAEELLSIEAEVAACNLRIDRLTAAATVAVHVTTAADLEAEKLAQAERIKRVAELNDDITKVAEQVAKQLIDLYEPLVRLEGLTRARHSTAWQALVSPFGTVKEAQRRVGAPFARLIENMNGVGVLLAALRASGLGTVGPSLAPWVQTQLSGVGSPEPALERMSQLQDGLMALIAEAEVVANAPPPTDDPDTYPEDLETGEPA